MAFEKPTWLRDLLESGWSNWSRGDWVDWWIVVIPPFSFTPGKWIETALDWILGPVNYSWDRVIGAWREVGQIWNIIIDQFGKVWDWFLDIDGWIWGVLDPIIDWVEDFVEDAARTVWGVLDSIIDWVEDFVEDAARTVWSWFTEAIPGYFATFGEWVWDQLDELDAIWESKWSPLKPIIDFWTFFGKRATDFFNDPVGWFAAVFAAGFALFLQTAGWPFLRVIESFLVRIWDEEE